LLGSFFIYSLYCINDARVMMAAALGSSQDQSNRRTMVAVSEFETSVDACRPSEHDAASGGHKPNSSDGVHTSNAGADSLPQDVGLPAVATDGAEGVGGLSDNRVLVQSQNSLHAPAGGSDEAPSEAAVLGQHERTKDRSAVSVMSALLKSSFGNQWTDGSNTNRVDVSGSVSTAFGNSKGSVDDVENKQAAQKKRFDTLQEIGVVLKRKRIELEQSESKSKTHTPNSCTTSIGSSAASLRPKDSMARVVRDDPANSSVSEYTGGPLADSGVKRRRVEEEENKSPAVSKPKPIVLAAIGCASSSSSSEGCADKAPKVVLSGLSKCEMNNAVDRDKLQKSSSSSSVEHERRETGQDRHTSERHHALKSFRLSTKGPSDAAASIELSSEKTTAIGRPPFVERFNRDKLHKSSSPSSSVERERRVGGQDRHTSERHHALKSFRLSTKGPSDTAASAELSSEKATANSRPPFVERLTSHHTVHSKCDSLGRVVQPVKRFADSHDMHASKRNAVESPSDRTVSSDKREMPTVKLLGRTDGNERPTTSVPSRWHASRETRDIVEKPQAGSRSSSTTSSSKTVYVTGTKTAVVSQRVDRLAPSSVPMPASSGKSVSSQKSKWSTYSIPRKPTASCMDGVRSDVTHATHFAQATSTDNTMKSLVDPPPGRRNSCNFVTGREPSNQAFKEKTDASAPRVQSSSPADRSSAVAGGRPMNTEHHHTKGETHQLGNKQHFTGLPVRGSTSGSRNWAPQSRWYP
jgi:hypothetical protein